MPAERFYGGSGLTRDYVSGVGDIQPMEDHRLDLARVILPKLFWSLAGIGVAVTVGIIAWHLGWFAWSLV